MLHPLWSKAEKGLGSISTLAGHSTADREIGGSGTKEDFPMGCGVSSSWKKSSYWIRELLTAVLVHRRRGKCSNRGVTLRLPWPGMERHVGREVSKYEEGAVRKPVIKNFESIKQTFHRRAGIREGLKRGENLKSRKGRAYLGHRVRKVRELCEGESQVSRKNEKRSKMSRHELRRGNVRRGICGRRRTDRG